MIRAMVTIILMIINYNNCNKTYYISPSTQYDYYETILCLSVDCEYREVEINKDKLMKISKSKMKMKKEQKMKLKMKKEKEQARRKRMK